MADIFNFKIFELWDRFLSAGFLDMIQSLLAARVVYLTMMNIATLTDQSNDDLLKTSVGTEDEVINIQSELVGARIRVFVMIGGVALDVFFITFINMVTFITSQKKMKCKALPCMRSNEPAQNQEGQQQGDVDFKSIFLTNPNMKAQNICIKYAFLADLSIWVGLVGLAIEFNTFSEKLSDTIDQLNQPNMSQPLFELYIDMQETVNNASQMFNEIALIYGLLLGILILFIIWEILDYVFVNHFTKCIIRFLCCCFCIPEDYSSDENQFLEQVKSLNEFQDSFDQAIVLER